MKTKQKQDLKIALITLQVTDDITLFQNSTVDCVTTAMVEY